MTVTVRSSNVGTATSYGHQKKVAVVGGYRVAVSQITQTTDGGQQDLLQFDLSLDGASWVPQVGVDTAILRATYLQGAAKASLAGLVDTAGRLRVACSFVQTADVDGRTSGTVYLAIGTINPSPSTPGLAVTWGTALAVPTFNPISGWGGSDVAVVPDGSGGLGWVVTETTTVGTEAAVFARQFVLTPGGAISFGSFQTVWSTTGSTSSIGPLPSIDMDPVSKRAAVVYNQGIDAADGGSTRVRILKPDATMGDDHLVAAMVGRQTGTGDAREVTGVTCRFDPKYQQFILMGPHMWDGTNLWEKVWWRNLADTAGGEMWSVENPADVLAEGSGAVDPFNGAVFLFGSKYVGIAGGSQPLRFHWLARSSPQSLTEIGFQDVDASTSAANVSVIVDPSQIHVLWTVGTANPWTVRYTTVTLNKNPNAPQLLDPVGGTGVDINQPHTFRIAASDPDAGDTISALNLRWRMVGDTSWITTGWISGNQPSRLVAAGTFTTGNWEWQAATKDARGADSPWSSSAFFPAGEAPSDLTIVTPMSDQTVNETAVLQWTSISQSSFQYQRIADLAGSPDPTRVFFDSGEIGEQDTRDVIVSFDVTDRYEWLPLRVFNGGIPGPWEYVRVLVAFIPPGAVTVIVTADPDNGQILLSITNHPGQAAVPDDGTDGSSPIFDLD